MIENMRTMKIKTLLIVMKEIKPLQEREPTKDLR
jgi:hypothetical protein